MSGSKRVIILDKVNSPAIAQAIFILKDDTSAEFSAVEEAERIVNEYLSGFCFTKRRTRFPLIITLAALFFAVICVICFAKL